MSYSLRHRFALSGMALLCAAPMALAQEVVPAADAAPLQEEQPLHITPSDGRSGTFKSVQGEVTVVSGDTRRAAVVGGGLHDAERILTGADGMASLVLKDGTMLSVGKDSDFDLRKFEFDSTTHQGNVLVSLLRGSMRMATGLIAKLQPEQVKVTTPTTVIGVRGTDFIVEVKP